MMSDGELEQARQRLQKVERRLSVEVEKRRRPARVPWMLGYTVAATLAAVRRRLR
jgi:hypothetical protein